MSFAVDDLREDILTIFAERQGPWQRELVNEIVRLIGCQKLRDVAAKMAWAHRNKDKQRSYSQRHFQNLTPEQRKLRNERQRAWKAARRASSQ